MVTTSTSGAGGAAAFSDLLQPARPKMAIPVEIRTANKERHDENNRESQKDSGPKPRVARNELPWVRPRKGSSTPTGLYLFSGELPSSGAATAENRGCLE